MTTYRWSFLDDVLAYRAAGVSGIGVWRNKLDDFGEERGAELLRESGLTVTSLSFAGGFTGTEGQSHREAIDEALAAVELASDIGAQTLVVVSGSRAGHTLNHARRLLCDALLEIGDAAAERQLHLAVQSVRENWGSKWTFLNSLDATLDVLHLCDHAHVGMVFDTYQLWREPNLCERIPEFASLIKTVQVSDWRNSVNSDNDRRLPGDGEIPLPQIMGSLLNAGYNGWFDVQILSDEYWNCDYEVLVKSCQDAFGGVCAQLVAAAQNPA